MSDFVIMTTPLVVDERGQALVPDVHEGQLLTHLYDAVTMLAWVTPELGGITLAITGQEAPDADYIGDGLVFALDDDRLSNLIDDLTQLRSAMWAAQSAPSYSPVTDSDIFA